MQLLHFLKTVFLEASRGLPPCVHETQRGRTTLETTALLHEFLPLRKKKFHCRESLDLLNREIYYNMLLLYKNAKVLYSMYNKWN